MLSQGLMFLYVYQLIAISVLSDVSMVINGPAVTGVSIATDDVSVCAMVSDVHICTCSD